ncbi:SC5A1-like protein [Mya arenaria]|uniref:Sodium/myo-inositol cotransporter 2 n=1 Tax=Mya arenaria TaxID=6604 RepID=A0ABY7FL76_MYAAR|nr:SC5A1-like protein [Mya arenaria]
MADTALTHWADILTIILYFVFVLAVGIWVGASLFGSNIGSEHFIGLAGSGAANGIVFVLFEWIPALLVQLLSWFFLPVFISAGVYTLPEYMERRFGRGRLRIYLSVLALFLHIVNRLSATIFSGAIYIQLAFRWNMYPSIVGILLITGIFTIFDAFHVLRGMDADFPWPTMILQAGVASAWYWICDQIMVQRCLAARNISHAKSGTLLGGYLKILPLFIMIIPGMISRILYPDEVACADPETCLKVCDNAAGCSNIAYPKLVLELLPKGARGLIMAVMLSAIVTSLTSIFNSSSTVFTMDIWRRFRPAAKQKELLLVGRLYIIALCGLTIAWIPVVKAAQGGQLFQYIVVIEGFITAPLPILFALVVFWDRTSEQGAFYSILIANVLGLARFVLEAVYPVPNCGEPDTRPGTTWSTRIKPGVIDKLNEDGLVMKEVSVDFQNSDTEDCSQATENNELLENGNAIEQVAIMKSNRLRDFLRNVCGVTEGDDNVSVEINVKDRLK